MRSYKYLRATILTGIILSASQRALCAGFYLTEVGSPGSLGTAGTANPTNTLTADSAWTNPAGMTGLTETSIMTGVQLLLPKIKFDSNLAQDVGTGAPITGGNGGNAGDIAGIPSFFYVRP